MTAPERQALAYAVSVAKRGGDGQRAYRDELAPSPDHEHGTCSGYTWWRCRCSSCRDGYMAAKDRCHARHIHNMWRRRKCKECGEAFTVNGTRHGQRNKLFCNTACRQRANKRNERARLRALGLSSRGTPLRLEPAEWEELADAIETGADHPLDELIEGRNVVIPT